MRREAFEEAMAEYGLPAGKERILCGDFDFATGERYMQEWAEQGRKLPGAFVCANDNIAAGLCSAAMRLGYEIPRDFWVTGFDNLDKAAYFKPQISTVEHNRGNIGGSALQVLSSVWKGDNVEQFLYFTSECIFGESCGCPNSGRVDYRDYAKWQIEYLVMADKKMYEIKSARKRKEKMKFLKGVDISSLPEHLDGREKIYTADGRCVDPFELLKENHINSVRLRIWNDPSQFEDAKGYCDLGHTVWMAKRIKENGMHFMLDFHYSDFWADPGQQRKPHAWENLSFEELKEAVYTYTSDVLHTLEVEGCLPDIVQVGNEIRSGMLFPDGAVPNYKNLAELINAGIRAVREVSKDISVMIHLDQGGRFFYLKEWFDAVFAAGMEPIDALGISFYSFWHGTFMDLKSSMEQLIERYQLPVYVSGDSSSVETLRGRACIC